MILNRGDDTVDITPVKRVRVGSSMLGEESISVMVRVFSLNTRCHAKILFLTLVGELVMACGVSGVSRVELHDGLLGFEEVDEALSELSGKPVLLG